MEREDTVERCYLNTIGCLLKEPSLLDDIDKPLDRTDFETEKFYELLFVAVYNLHMQGCEVIDEFAIDSYLSAFPEQYEIFQKHDGLDYLVSAKEISAMENYDFFYNKLRKFSLLRFYEKQGYDTRKFFNSTITDTRELEKELIKFDNYKIVDIVDQVENSLVTIPTMRYCNNTLTTGCQAGKGLDALVNRYKESPDIGLPLNSVALTTSARGARKGCLYMRSCPSGGGKSRMAAGDACKVAVSNYFDLEKNEWMYKGFSEPCLYITTEMAIEEIQTIFIATVSGVNEEHILDGIYEEGELERVKKANKYIEASPLYICHIPDFSIEDIKGIIKEYNRKYGIEYFFFDYIHSSLRLMSEINKKSGMGLQEHQLLLVFVTELKALCQRLDIFIFTASQLNGEAVNALIKDQNLLAGSKALANKLDGGFICMAPSKSELKRIEPVLHKMVNCPIPNMCTWVYKVRKGKLTRVVIWSLYDLGIMRVKDLFVTNNNFELIDMDFTRVEQADKIIEENSVEPTDLPEKTEKKQLESKDKPVRKFEW